MQVLAHAFAKAAMFFSAGLLAEALGHDQIAKLRGAARALPLTFLTIALGGLSLVGLPPSGGFSAKWLMLQASVASGQWVWSLPILAGGLLTAGYVYRILVPALSDGEISLKSPPKRSQEVIALAHNDCPCAWLCTADLSLTSLKSGRPAGGRGRHDRSFLHLASREFGRAFGASRRLFRQRLEARALAPCSKLAPAPGLATGLLGLTGAPFTCDLPVLGFTLSLDSPSALLLAVAALLWIVVSAALWRDRPPDDRFGLSGSSP